MLVPLSTEVNISVTRNAGGDLLARRTPLLRVSIRQQLPMLAAYQKSSQWI